MIVEKVYKWLEKESRVFPQHVNRASEIGHPCLRYLVFLRTAWDKKTPPPPDAMLRFIDGKLHEKAVLEILQNAGFEIIEQQRAFYWDKFKISGHIDAKIVVEGKTYPLEIKSASPFVWTKVSSIEDMLNSKYAYLKKYPAQMTIYLLMSDTEKGLMLFKNKSTGQLKEIWVTLDYDFAEELLKKAEKINEYVEKGEVPDPIEYDENVCDPCPFVHICLVDTIREPIQFVENADLLEKLDRWWELKPLVEEYQALEREITKAIEGQEKLVVGNYFITGKWIERKGYYVPPTKYWRKSIRRLPRGSL